MKKMMLSMILMLFAFVPVMANGPQPVRIGIDGKPKYAGQNTVEKDCKCLVCLCGKNCECGMTEKQIERQKSERLQRQIDAQLKRIEELARKEKERQEKARLKYVPHTRRWIEDVTVPGLWYYGYYSSDGLEFRFSRREYKSALANFDSLVHPAQRVNANRPSVKVVYEYPY